MVEPYLSKQWFVKMRPLADRVLENQRIKIVKLILFLKDLKNYESLDGDYL